MRRGIPLSKRLALSAALYCILALASSSKGAIRIDGSILLRGYTPLGECFVERSRTFDLVLEGCSWQVRLADTSTNRHADLLFWNIFSDGQDVFYLEQYDPVPRARTVFDPQTNQTLKKHVALSPNAYVDPGCFPHHRSTLAAPLFLAYGSGCHLATNSTGRLRQTWEFDDENLEYTTFTLAAEWILTKSSPHFAERVVYHCDGKYHANSKGKSVVVEAAPPYNHGWTNAVYEVLSMTNLAGFPVPHRARFTRFAPRPEGTKASDLIILTTIDIETKNLSSTDQAPALPAIEPGLLVNDNRFRPEIQSPIAYQSDGGWLTARQVRKLPDFAPQFRIATPPSKPFATVTPVLGYCVLAGLVVVPPLLWLVRRVRKASQQ